MCFINVKQKSSIKTAQYVLSCNQQCSAIAKTYFPQLAIRSLQEYYEYNAECYLSNVAQMLAFNDRYFLSKDPRTKSLRW